MPSAVITVYNAGHESVCSPGVVHWIGRLLDHTADIKGFPG